MGCYYKAKLILYSFEFQWNIVRMPCGGTQRGLSAPRGMLQPASNQYPRKKDWQYLSYTYRYIDNIYDSKYCTKKSNETYRNMSRVVTGAERMNSTSPFLPWMS
jgi:hypothetical protein